MYQLIERVTCDNCGQQAEIEKIRTGVGIQPTVRIESLVGWVELIGWGTVHHSLACVEFLCPPCSLRRMGGNQKAARKPEETET